MSYQSEKIRLACHLGRRQRQVLERIAHGQNLKEIAFDLGISRKTAEYHLVMLRETVGLHQIADLTRLAIRLGLATVDV